MSKRALRWHVFTWMSLCVQYIQLWRHKWYLSYTRLSGRVARRFLWKRLHLFIKKDTPYFRPCVKYICAWHIFYFAIPGIASSILGPATSHMLFLLVISLHPWLKYSVVSFWHRDVHLLLITLNSFNQK